MRDRLNRDRKQRPLVKLPDWRSYGDWIKLRRTHVPAPSTCSPIPKAAGLQTQVCGAAREQAVPAWHPHEVALTMVLGPPGSDGSDGGPGDTECRQHCFLWGGLSLQDDEMRLPPRKEGAHVFTRLAATTRN